MNILEAFNTLNLSQISASIEDIKKAYKKSALKYHPDRNKAGLHLMQAVNNAYDFLLSLGVDPVVNKNLNSDYYDFSEDLNNVLNVVLDFEGLFIEICGNWIWITGDTKQHKEELKKLKFKWSPKKLAWYFRPEEYKRRKTSNDGKTMEEIREKYGSNKLNTKSFKKIA